VNDPLLYAGRRVVVTGAASGVGAATVEILVDLGAEVHAIDIEKPEVSGLASFTSVDLREPAPIERAAAKIGSVVNALFNCARPPGTSSDLDTLLVDFCGLRALTEALIPLMIEGSAIASVTSATALGPTADQEVASGLLGTPDFEGARAWCTAHLRELGNSGAVASAAVNAYAALRSSDLAQAGIRINTVNLRAGAGEAGSVWPLIFLNSPRAAAVNGRRLDVD
jgi:NAD(P)-dependent dehydrogenase (short-subunit alcohol dehydrogenase family)